MTKASTIQNIESFWNTGVFGHFNGVSGVRIAYAYFITPNATQTIVISSGRCECYLKYQELIYDLSKMNCNIFIHDHRGQGLSGRMLANTHKGYVVHFDNYANDLNTFINNVVKPVVARQTIKILAHSMGAAIAVRYMQLYPGKIKSAFLSSPMVAIETGGIPRKIARAIATFGVLINRLFSKDAWYFIGQNNYQVQPFEGNPLMESRERFDQFIRLYQQQSQVQLGGVTFSWLEQALKAEQEIFLQLSKINSPITIAQAESDTIVCNNAQNEFCRQLHTINPSLCTSAPQVIPNAKHELFFEIDSKREQVMLLLKSWLR